MYSIIFTYFIIQLTISTVLWYGNTKTKTITLLQKNENTTVIIPFKNEEKRILPLIESINKTAVTNKKNKLFSHFQFIFIDDHSTDESSQIILNNLDISFQIIRLQNTKGKKYAIKKGVEEANFDRVLTLDADVSFDESYLETITKTPCEALTILPVNMDSSFLPQRINAVEFWFLQRLTFGLAGLKKHILCNGANLLFTKSAFNKSLDIRQDANIPSGDDMFLLKAVNMLKLPINAFNHKSLLVNTLPPLTLFELINQRKRWISKSKDPGSIVGGLFVLWSNIFFIYALIALYNENPIYIIPILIKVLSEVICVVGDTKIITVIIHQIAYPFYLLMLLFSFLKKGNEWRE